MSSHTETSSFLQTLTGRLPTKKVDFSGDNWYCGAGRSSHSENMMQFILLFIAWFIFFFPLSEVIRNCWCLTPLNIQAVGNVRYLELNWEELNDQELLVWFNSHSVWGQFITGFQKIWIALSRHVNDTFCVQNENVLDGSVCWAHLSRC